MILSRLSTILPLLTLVSLSLSFHPKLSNTLDSCDGDTEFKICGNLNSNECFSYTYEGFDYTCDIGAEACGCIESSISASVVFLIDATGLDTLDSDNNDLLWNNVITYWPTSYVEEIAMNQVENNNIDYNWVLFGETVYQTGSYDGNDASFPWDNIDSLPSELSSQRNNVNICNALAEAEDIFESSNKISRTIIYFAFNDPATYQCDLPDYNVNFLFYRWGEEVDTSLEIRNYLYGLGGTTNCYYQDVFNQLFVPGTDTESVALFRAWQETASDFVCAAGNFPTIAPTPRPTAPPTTGNPTKSPTPSPVPAPTPSPVDEGTPAPVPDTTSGAWWVSYKNDYYYWQKWNNWYGWGKSSSSSSSSSSSWSSSSSSSSYWGRGRGRGYGYKKWSGGYKSEHTGWWKQNSY